MRIGFAKDIHKLVDYNKNKQIILGGCLIEQQQFSIKAKSDGDVILHSITSAILGSLGLKTIGEYFPDTCDSNENRDSMDFLIFALDELEKVNMKIISIDLCIVCEQVMLKDYLPVISDKLKSVLKTEHFGIKCTRFEEKDNHMIECNCALIINNIKI
ncbi:MAG: 2-C-methyl-D-erythritol 2,4-cyclodiphosphate synthase [Mycoplasma sp.]